MTDEKKVNYNPPVPPVVRNYDNNIEYGKIGQKRSYRNLLGGVYPRALWTTRLRSIQRNVR